MIQRLLAPLAMNDFELHIYFGRTTDSRYEQTQPISFSICYRCRSCARPLRTPSQPMELAQHTGDRRKRYSRLPPGACGACSNWSTSRSRAAGYGQKKHTFPRFDLAILHDPDNPEPPSNAKALQKFRDAAEELSMRVKFITRADIGRLPQFDALFIRDTTFVNHYTYYFSRLASRKGWW